MSRQKKKRKKKSLHLFIPFWIALCIFFSCVIFTQAVKYDELKRDEQKLTQSLEEEDKLTAELNMELKYYESDAYIEKIAREKLDLVMPDETIFNNIAGD